MRMSKTQPRWLRRRGVPGRRRHSLTFLASGCPIPNQRFAYCMERDPVAAVPITNLCQLVGEKHRLMQRPGT